MDNTYTPITASNISFTTLVTDLEAFTDTTSLTSSQIQWLLNYFTSSCSTAKSSSTTSSAAIPTLSASDVSGNEDGKIALHISDSVSNAKESLFTLITGVPDGATLSRGTYVSFLHSWIVKGSDIANLTITPPKNFSGDIQIDVMAIGMLNNKFSLTTTSFDVMVNEVADRPTLTVHSAHGYDNAPIDLDITGHAKDSSGEVLTYKITGVPDGATLNHGVHNLDGSWTLSASDVIGLQLTTSVIQEHLDLTVQAISTVALGANAGSTAITMKTLSVDVDHLKFTPVLVVSNVSGSEDAAISIDSNNAFHLDVKFLDKEGHEVNHDTGSYQNKLANTVIIVSGLPSGATLNHGALQTDGSYVLHYSDLSGLTLMPPHDFSGSMDLTVIAVYTRSPGMVNQVFTSLPSALHIDIGASADAPTLSVSDASGNEDTFISLNGHISAALTDNSENLSIHISGVPAGATMMGATFDSVSGDYIVNDLSILAIKPPTDSEVDFNLTIKAISTEPSNGNSATTTALLHVDVQAVADAPSVFVDTVTQHFIEGNAIAIGSYIHGALAPNEVIEGDEALKYLISNLPVGASLVGFTPDVNGVYSIDSMQLADLMLDPGASFVGAISLSVQTEAIENSNGDLAFSANTATLSLIIDPSVSAPTLSVANAIGDEDTTIGLVISGALTGTNTTGETLTFDISNVPSGSILHVTSGDLIADVNGVYHVPSSEIGSLTITPPLDFEGSISLSVIATATEGMFSASSSAQTLGIDVHPMAEIPMLLVGSNALSMDENHTVDLSIGLATPGHTLDGVDDTLFVKIMGVTDGAVLSAGTFDSASGAWTVASTALGGLYLTPASDFDGSLHLTVVGYSTDGTGTLLSSSSTGVETLDITINPVAETPILSLGSATISTTEDHTIDLSIDLTQQPELSHDDILYVKIAGVGSAYALSAGTFDSGSGEWTVDSTALGGLHLIPNSGSEFDGMMNLSVIGYAQDGAAVAMTGMQNIAISVAGVAEAPVLSVSDVIIGAVSSVGSGSLTDVSAAKAASNDSMAVVGPGGIPFPLSGLVNLNGHIIATPFDSDDNPPDFYINGIPSGSMVYGATLTANGWHFSDPSLLSFTPHTANGTLELTVTAIGSEPGASGTASSFGTLHVYMPPVAPVITGFSDDTGVLGDHITSDATPIYAGTAESGVTLYIYQDGVLMETMAGSNNWSFEGPNALSDGAHTLDVVAIQQLDASHYLISSDASFTLTIDTPPAAPVISGFSDNSGSILDNITNDATPTLNGTAEAGAEVKVYEGAVLLGTATADINGNYRVALGNLGDGNHTFIATATDVTANASDPTSFVLSIDATLPVITLVNPILDATEGASYIFTFTGSDTGGSGVDSVKVYDNGTLLGDATLDAVSGNYLYDYTSLGGGLHTISGTVFDVAGNSATATDVFTVDIPVISIPSLTVNDSNIPNELSADIVSLTIAGTAESFVKIVDVDSSLTIAAAIEPSMVDSSWSFNDNSLHAGLNHLDISDGSNHVDFFVRNGTGMVVGNTGGNGLNYYTTTLASTLPAPLPQANGADAAAVIDSHVITISAVAKYGIVDDGFWNVVGGNGGNGGMNGDPLPGDTIIVAPNPGPILEVVYTVPASDGGAGSDVTFNGSIIGDSGNDIIHLHSVSVAGGDAGDAALGDLTPNSLDGIGGHGGDAFANLYVHAGDGNNLIYMPDVVLTHGLTKVETTDATYTVLGGAAHYTGMFIAGAGDDTFYVGNASVGAGTAFSGTVDGGLGTDTLSFEKVASGISVDFANSLAGNYAMQNFEEFKGSNFNDTFTINSLTSFNHIDGKSGFDTITLGVTGKLLDLRDTIHNDDKFLGINAIDLGIGKGNSIQLDSAALQKLATDVYAPIGVKTLFVNGDASDTIYANLTQQGYAYMQITANSQLYDLYTNSTHTAALAVDHDILNAGTLVNILHTPPPAVSVL